MFDSTQQAMQFAFHISGVPIVKTSGIYSMVPPNKKKPTDKHGNEVAIVRTHMRCQSPELVGLTIHERHAQAAMIIACVERAVDTTGMAYIRAHYGRELFGGEHARIVADILVRAVVGALGTGMHSRRGLQKLILNYFGKDITLANIANDLNCTLYIVTKKRGVVYDALDAVGTRADIDAELALYNAGLIGD